MAAGSGRVTVRVDINRTRLNAMLGWHGEVGRSFSRLARATVVQQRISAPKQTGRLAKSINYKKLSGPKGISFESGSSVRYALWMEKGTRPHIIRPKHPGGMLVFYWPKVGRKVYLKSVRHPGTKPYNYLANGLRRALRAWNITG